MLTSALAISTHSYDGISGMLHPHMTTITGCVTTTHSIISSQLSVTWDLSITYCNYGNCRKHSWCSKLFEASSQISWQSWLLRMRHATCKLTSETTFKLLILVSIFTQNNQSQPARGFGINQCKTNLWADMQQIKTIKQKCFTGILWLPYPVLHPTICGPIIHNSKCQWLSMVLGGLSL